MTNKITISVIDSHFQTYALIRMGDTLVTQTRERSAKAAVREAVRQFRLARADRLVKPKQQ